MAIKKIYPPTYFNLSWLLMIVLHFFIPFLVLYTGFWKMIGIFPISIGVYLNLAADKLLKINDTTVKPGEQSEILVQSGVFKLSRNPMYLGMALILFGIAIILGSVTPFIVLIIFVFLINKNFISIEESMLEDKFGTNWIEYKKNVRLWI